LGILPKDFFDLTIAELSCLLKHKEDQVVREAENIRYLAASSLNSNPYLKKEIKPSDLFPLPTDRSAPKMERSSFEESVKRMKKVVPFNIA